MLAPNAKAFSGGYRLEDIDQAIEALASQATSKAGRKNLENVYRLEQQLALLADMLYQAETGGMADNLSEDTRKLVRRETRLLNTLTGFFPVDTYSTGPGDIPVIDISPSPGAPSCCPCHARSSPRWTACRLARIPLPDRNLFPVIRPWRLPYRNLHCSPCSGWACCSYSGQGANKHPEPPCSRIAVFTGAGQQDACPPSASDIQARNSVSSTGDYHHNQNVAHPHGRLPAGQDYQGVLNFVTGESHGRESLAYVKIGEKTS
jgi:hypothetical protein